MGDGGWVMGDRGWGVESLKVHKVVKWQRGWVMGDGVSVISC
jgi:hypothetical protein